MARKNGLVGAVPNAGRPKSKENKTRLSVSITEEAQEVLKGIKEKQRGNFVSEAIIEHFRVIYGY